MNLKDIKKANPTKFLEYAVARKFGNEPTFAWWVPYTAKKKHRIITKM